MSDVDLTKVVFNATPHTMDALRDGAEFGECTQTDMLNQGAQLVAFLMKTAEKSRALGQIASVEIGLLSGRMITLAVDGTEPDVGEKPALFRRRARHWWR